MRPIRLEMEGFTSFRDKTVVDLEDADQFVLTGPTGAGKSSVIDAITFALYGSIPRLGARAVAPVISQGMLQARVRLDFSVSGKAYSAVRVARATKTGAATPEARLEDHAGNTLAGSARELSNEIEKLLGLTFDHFTRSVVLPQGDFAELLHESPGNRQDLLVRLLGAELYDRLAKRAGQRRTTSEALADNLKRDIEQLEDEGATPDALDEARQRSDDLAEVVNRIRERQPDIAALQERGRSAKQRSVDAQMRLHLLSSVRLPDGVTELAERIAAGNRGLAAAKEAHSEVGEDRQRRQDTLDGLPNEAELSLILQRYDDLAKALKRRGVATSNLRDAEQVLGSAQNDERRLRKAADAAEHTKRSMEDTHSAYHLAQGLEPGRTCPVCRQHVSVQPEMETPADIHEAETALKTAKDDHEYANAKLKTAQTALDSRKQSLTDWDNSVKGLEAELNDSPGRAEVEESLKKVKVAEAALQKANEDEKQAGLLMKKAQEAVEELESGERSAWREYDKQRDQIAEMQPPSAERDDLAVAWRVLVDWAKEQSKEQSALHEEAEAERERAESSLAELRGTIVQWCLEVDIAVVDDEEPLAACSREQGRQSGEVKRIEDGLEGLKQKRAELERRQREVEVATDLTRHLDARRFERWLMAQVLELLCVGATSELRKLSNEAYSLALDERNDFLVIDHRNADDRRPVKTLSGGETFLASLSLALALSEHLADLAVGGAAKLEALFLDEGFGTLDSDTLDVVISAIEELGSHGRMVGVVTHVKELAESIPVRYEVTKQGNRSSIERVEA